MKFKKILLALAAGLTFSLAACGDSEEPTTPTPSSSSSSSDSGSGSEAITSALSFMSNNKLRVDIFGDLGVSFKYGDEAVVSTREITIVNDLTFTYSGDCSVEKINYIAYTERDTGSTINWHKGIDASYFLNNVLPSTNFNGISKIYIAISTGEVQWTKGLSEKLDQAFNGYMGV